ncbi:hypothetical protein WNZ15_22075 [Roseibium sp. AS2]|uniref:hypothetical protein n=1 Tax=Roseibium sp. AS2 TaxID=3135781 RepID=UPI00317A5BBE
MTHDHHHHHHHDHTHGPGHADGAHGHEAHGHGAHGHGHNHAGHDHLHSHVHAGSSTDRADEIQALCTSFIDGFRSAEDKTSYLRLAGVPFHKPGTDHLVQHLVDARIVSDWQVGTASPAFASRELVYLPFPGPMVQARETMSFTYVSLTERTDTDLIEILTQRLSQGDIAE